MRLTFSICLFCVLQSFAIGTFSQNVRLSINQKNISVESVIQLIEDKTDYYFMYSALVVNVKRTVDIEATNKLVPEILDDIFKGTDTSFKIDGRLIALSKNGEISQVVQQQKTVSGIVTDSSGAPLPGVTVVVKGTSTGIITDTQGKYSLSNIPADATLQFSFIGMKAQEIAFTGKSVINVVLVEETIGIEEVVAVGYGTQRKEDATGSVQQVSTKDFNKGMVSSPEQLLSGRIAGLSITSNSGEPGGQISVRLRGGTSINAGNEPLYVIDDIPLDNSPYNPSGFSAGRNPLNSINPTDILDITVLKDASSTAIYGSRGANGVIMIRTKRGKMGENGIQSIDYSSSFSFSSIAKKYDVLTASEYSEAIHKYAPERSNYIGNATTNWQNEIFQNATSQKHDIGISGGAKNLSYRVSLGYQDEEGILKGTSSERVSGSVSFNQNLFDKMLEVSGNFRNSKMTDYFADNGAIYNALAFNPTVPIRNGDNTKYGGYFEYDDVLTTSNPVALIEQKKDDSSTLRSMGNIEFKYKFHFYPKVNLKVNLAYDISDGIRRSYIPLSAIGNTQLGTDNGEIRKDAFFKNSNLLETYLQFNDHLKDFNCDINALLGYSYQDFLSETSSFRATQLTSDILGYNSTSSASIFEAATQKQGNNLISYFGRFNINLKDRYLFTFTLREDGSSRFSSNYRWGTFPSASVAWRIIEEPFINKFGKGFFSNLKLRAGWGITGNQEIGNYNFLPTFTLGDSKSTIQFGDKFINTLRPNGVDRNLKWEETSQSNIGLDFGFWNNRINCTLDAYKKNTKDLLFVVAVPQPFLNTKVLTNIGEVENKGVEFSIDSYLINNKIIKWNLAFNVAYNRNKIIDLGSNDPTFFGYEVGSISGGTGNTIQILKEGESVNSFFVYEHIIKDRKPIYQDKNGDGTINEQDIYVDQNGDKVINSNDKIIKGSPNPDLTYGLSSLIQIGNLDVNISLKAATGNYIYNNVASNNSLQFIKSEAVPKNILKRTEQNGFFENQYFSSFFVNNASYLRVDNITIGYSFKIPQTNIKPRVYLTGQNLFLITGYSGLDPEVVNVVKSNSITVQQFGIDNNIYPRAKALLFGISLNL